MRYDEYDIKIYDSGWWLEHDFDIFAFSWEESSSQLTDKLIFSEGYTTNQLMCDVNLGVYMDLNMFESGIMQIWWIYWHEDTHVANPIANHPKKYSEIGFNFINGMM